MNCNCSVNFKIVTPTWDYSQSTNKLIYNPVDDVIMSIYNLGSFKWWLTDEGWDTYNEIYKEKNNQVGPVILKDNYTSSNFTELGKILEPVIEKEDYDDYQISNIYETFTFKSNGNSEINNNIY